MAAAACISATVMVDLSHSGFGHSGQRDFGSSFYVAGSCCKTIFTAYGPRTVDVCDSIY